MLSWIYWDPNPVAFYLPILGHPIVWYGVLFALAFFVGFYLLGFLFRRFLCFYPEIGESDVKDWNHVKKKLGQEVDLEKLNCMLEDEVKEDPPESLILHFATRVLSAEALVRFKNRLYLEKVLGYGLTSLKEKSKAFSEKLAVYVIVGTVVGARLGHLLFYEELSSYLANPLTIFKTWEGGLACHGGVVGILLSILLFYYRSRKEFPMVSLIRIVDMIVIPGLYAGILIRFGNFINQEILGKATEMAWGVVFMHPAGGLPVVPRHPAQLYEAFFFLFAFLAFFRLYPRLLFPAGRLAGLFFIATFLFRFLVEFVKEEQSHIFSHQIFTMGQYLSIPLILFGVVILLRSKLLKWREG